MNEANLASFGLFVPPDKHAKFDRTAKQPPLYIDRLRGKGWWRMVDYLNNYPRYTGYPMYISSALRHSYYWSKGKQVFLDAGCGDSPDALLAIVELKYQKSYKVDLWPTTRSDNIFSQRFHKLEEKAGVSFIQGDVCKRLPLKSKSIDTISANAMIELIAPDDRMLFYKEAYRLLRPKGLLSVSCVSLVNGWLADRNEVNRATEVGFVILQKGYNFVVQKP